MNLKSWVVGTSLLAAIATITAVGCAPTSRAVDRAADGAAVASVPAPPPAELGEEAEIAPDPAQLSQWPPDRESLPEIITGMEVGMPYAEARTLIDQEIWAPRTYPPLTNVSGSVQTLLDLGYEEVRDCAGTGLGLCRLEFIEREGLVLVIIITTSETEPKVWSWGVE